MRAATAWLWAALSLAAAAAVADPAASFKKGIEAADLKRWEEAARRMREAIAEEPQESEKRILLSGVFTRPYLPHFYLGMALYNAGSDHCEEALGAWEISLSQGVVRKLKRQHQELRQARDTCNGLLLPAAIAAAEHEIERAAEISGRPVDDPALAAARSRFETGKSESRLGDLRWAESEARAVAEQLTEVLDQASRATARRRSAAATSARQAIAEAAGAERELASLLLDPERITVWRRHPEIRMPVAAVELLRVAREKSGDGASLADLEAADTGAVAARARFAEAREQAESTFARDLAEQDRRADSGDTPVPAARTLAGAQATPTPAAEPPAGDGDSATAAAVRRLAESAERLLGLVGPGESSSQLLEVQRSRLTLLVLEARERSAPEIEDEGLPRQLADSAAALQLIAGAEAYLGGDPRHAIEILTLAELADGQLAAQVHLFLAASRFALYRLGGELDARLRAQAAASVAECRALDPALAANPRSFPPPFRQLFAQNR